MNFLLPSAILLNKKIKFNNGKLLNLPNLYSKNSNLVELSEFYNILFQESSNILDIGVDPLGFNYYKKDNIIYLGILTFNKNVSTFNSLKKKYPSHKFEKDFVIKCLDQDIKISNFIEYIPIELVTQNLHELRGLNAKISENIDALIGVENEDEWDKKFEETNVNYKKIYVSSRLTKFILDNTKFYSPNFWDNLTFSDRLFNPHRCISKIIKIYTNNFKKEKPEIEFSGSSRCRLKGDKEYFEILIKIFIENAIKYSTINSIGPKVKVFETSEKIVIEVYSYGSLIPFEDQNYLFEKGFRSRINNSKIEGSGMGLFNAKKIIEKFKGTITINTSMQNKNGDYEVGWNIFKLVFNEIVAS